MAENKELALRKWAIETARKIHPKSNSFERIQITADKVLNYVEGNKPVKK